MSRTVTCIALYFRLNYHVSYNYESGPKQVNVPKRSAWLSESLIPVMKCYSSYKTIISQFNIWVQRIYASTCFKFKLFNFTKSSQTSHLKISVLVQIWNSTPLGWPSKFRWLSKLILSMRPLNWWVSLRTLSLKTYIFVSSLDKR